MKSGTDPGELRNLARKARPFRWFSACWMLAVLVLANIAKQQSLTIAFALLFFIAWPYLVDRLLGNRRYSPRYILRFQVFECAMVAAWLGMLSLPWVLVAASLVALLAGNAAQGGQRHLLHCTLAVVLAGFAAFGVSAGGVIILPTSTEAFALALLLPFTVSLGLASFRQAIRLHRARAMIQAKNQTLERLSERLSRYLPEAAQRRIVAEPECPLSLTRRFLTVLFVDLVEFSDLTCKLPAEALAMVLNDYQSHLTAELKSLGGTLCQLQGDGVLIFFGDLDQETERAEDALQCARFCAGLNEMRERLCEHWRHQGYVIPLAFRAGVASGHCTLGDWGVDQLDFTVIGEVVNLASRLQQQAAEGTTLVSESTWALLNDQISDQMSLSEPIMLTLKGFGQVSAHQLVN